MSSDGSMHHKTCYIGGKFALFARLVLFHLKKSTLKRLNRSKAPKKTDKEAVNFFHMNDDEVDLLLEVAMECS